MIYCSLGKRVARDLDSFQARRDEKNRRFVSWFAKETV